MREEGYGSGIQAKTIALSAEIEGPFIHWYED